MLVLTRRVGDLRRRVQIGFALHPQRRRTQPLSYSQLAYSHTRLWASHLNRTGPSAGWLNTTKPLGIAIAKTESLPHGKWRSVCRKGSSFYNKICLNSGGDE